MTEEVEISSTCRKVSYIYDSFGGIMVMIRFDVERTEKLKIKENMKKHKKLKNSEKKVTRKKKSKSETHSFFSSQKSI